MCMAIVVENTFRPYNGRLTGQSALILGRGPEVSSVVAQSLECYKCSFGWGSKGLVHLEMTWSLLRNDSTEERKKGTTQLSLLRYWPVNCRSAVLPLLIYDHCVSFGSSVRERPRLRLLPPLSRDLAGEGKFYFSSSLPSER